MRNHTEFTRRFLALVATTPFGERVHLSSLADSDAPSLLRAVRTARRLGYRLTLTDDGGIVREANEEGE
jgi:hypothetical protein